MAVYLIENANNKAVINNILNKIEKSSYYTNQGNTNKIYTQVMNDLEDAIEISVVKNIRDIPDRTTDGEPIKYRYSVYTNDGDFNFYFDPYREYIYIKSDKDLKENFNKKKTMKEYYSFSDNEHIIWDSEYDYYDEKAMQEIKDGWYQEYLDGLDEDEEPDNFETWYDDYVSSMYDIDRDDLAEELDNYVLPQIDKQINDDILLLSGNYGSNYPDFRPSGDGGVMWDNGIDGLKDYMFDFDRSVITTQNGILGVVCGDHDGTVSGQLFTLPDDKTELIKALGLEDEDEFDTDLYYGEIDERDFNKHINLMKPIKDTISGYNK